MLFDLTDFQADHSSLLSPFMSNTRNFNRPLRKKQQTFAPAADNPFDSDSEDEPQPSCSSGLKRPAPDSPPSRPSRNQGAVDNPFVDEALRLEDASISSDVRRRRLDTSVSYIAASSAPLSTPQLADSYDTTAWTTNADSEVVVEEVVGLPGAKVTTTQSRARYENSVHFSSFESPSKHFLMHIVLTAGHPSEDLASISVRVRRRTYTTGRARVLYRPEDLRAMCEGWGAVSVSGVCGWGNGLSGLHGARPCTPAVAPSGGESPRLSSLPIVSSRFDSGVEGRPLR